ncbi:MAG: hypothetical protein OXN97_13050 [Bryobacterales bacterium]|nr:hypothetical protein [Bryobacterales bacterium]
MDRKRPDMTAGEILLLGGWLFYIAFIGTNTAFYGLGFAAMVCIVVPIGLICGACLFRRPFRSALVIALVTLVARSVLNQLEIALPDETLPVRAGMVATLPAVALGFATRWASARRKCNTLRRCRETLAEFEVRAQWAVRNLSFRERLTPVERRFAIDIQSGAASSRLDALLRKGKMREFDEGLQQLESQLKGIPIRPRDREGSSDNGPTDPYEIFMCQPNASFQDFKDAYNAYRKCSHPDAVESRGGNVARAEEQMKAGNLAFEEIKRRMGRR